MTNKKKIIKFIGIFFLGLLLTFIVYVIFVQVQISRGELIKFKGHFYTKDEWVKIFDPNSIIVPEKNTPEDVYSAFRQALLEERYDDALAFFSDYRKNEYKELMKDESRVKEWVKRLPINITKEVKRNNTAIYRYSNANDKEDEFSHPIDFKKNSDGYWMINQI